MFYLDVLLLHSMQHLPSSYLWQIKVTTVVPTLTYQHLYAKHHAYTMSPAWNMHPSTQHTLHPNHPATMPHYETQLTSPRPMCHCLTFVSDSSESDQDPDSSSDCSSDEEEDFPTVPMDDEHWTTEMVPEGHFAYMKMGYPTMYANAHAHMGIIPLPHIWTA